ncbi:MAG TPA: hypothetical protein VEI96_00050 [Thermodesulfovibrionales bacterium]|nr:hypothetical protein [Thermodesulfovibrionales bacterium]
MGRIIIGVSIVFCLLMGQVILAMGADSTAVSCYVGNPDNNQLIGDVEVFNISSAVARCNMMYMDCNGNCTACYISENGSQSCIDSTGRQYTRQ